MSEKYKPHTYSGETPHDFDRPYRTDDLEPVIVPPEGTEAVAAVQEVVNRIDYQVLLDIFREEYSKAGIDRDTLVAIPRSRVQVIYAPGVTFVGRYRYYDEQIQLNAAKLMKAGGVDVTKTLHTFIHEQLHYISTAEEIIDDITDTLHVGVEKTAFFTHEDIPSKITHEFLNEGLTEIITGRILHAYTTRVGNGSNNSTKIDFENGFNIAHYIQNQGIIRRLIIFYSVLTDVPEPTVEDSFVRAYLRNTSLFTHEMTALSLTIENTTISGSDLEIITTCLEEGIFNEVEWAEIAKRFLPVEKRVDFLHRLYVLGEQKIAAIENKIAAQRNEI